MAELLKVDGLRSGYGEAVVVQGISLNLEHGQSLALLGRNGTGKTTLLNTLVGVTRRHAGRISLGGQDITALAPYQRAAAGIGWVPQERNIFKSLTVHENLTAVARPGAWTTARAYEMFNRDWSSDVCSSDLLNTLLGVTRRHAGRISLGGQDITALAPYQIGRASCRERV